MKTYWEQVKIAQDKALSKKMHVGAICIGHNFETLKTKIFSGSNLHISDSFADVHAEQLAVSLAILDRYYPIAIHVTSSSINEKVLLCGSCRHFVSEININCKIIVHNPDGSVKLDMIVNEVYPLAKNNIKKNLYFKRLCGFKKI